MTDIRTLDQTTFGTPLAIYEAIQEASRNGMIEFDFLHYHDGSDGLGMLQNGMHVATLVSAWTREDLPGIPVFMRPTRMLRWWVPRHGGGTHLVATAGQP